MKDTLKFRFEDNQFFVNEDKRTVACCLTGTLKGLESYEEYLLDKYGSGQYACGNWDCKTGAQNFKLKVWAKAKADPEDEWNETLGEQIAESRAKQKVYTMLYKITAAKQAELLKELAQVDAIADKYLNLCSIEAGHLNILAE